MSHPSGEAPSTVLTASKHGKRSLTADHFRAAFDGLQSVDLRTAEQCPLGGQDQLLAVERLPDLEALEEPREDLDETLPTPSAGRS